MTGTPIPPPCRGWGTPHIDEIACPDSAQTRPTVVDDEGFCTQHGWDCGDYGLFLDL